MKQIALTIMVVGFVSFGCSSLGNNDATTTAPSTQSANNSVDGESVIPGSNPSEEVVTIARHIIAQPSYRAVTQTVGEPKSRTEVEFVAPDKVRARTKDVESISIGTDKYIKLFGIWQKYGTGNSRLSSGREEFEAIIKDGAKSVSNISFVGEELVMEKPALVYSYSIKMEGPPVQYDVRIWASKADGLPLKVQYDYHSGPLKNKKKVTTFFEFGADISIEPPVKD